MTAKKDKKAKKHKGIDSPMPTTLRELVESIGMAILMAIGLKYFLVEAYSIPSPSMQPTLLGSTAAGAYDRILVNKAAYLLSDPDRWQVAVFRYPHNRSQNYVKRIVGLPGETLRITGGDIFKRGADEQLDTLRKPRSLQDAFWRRIWHQESSDGTKPPLGPGEHRWQNDALVLESEGRLTRSITIGESNWYRDHYQHGYPLSIEEAVVGDVGGPAQAFGKHATGDLRVAFEAQLDKDWKRFFVRISEQDVSGNDRELELSVERDGNAGKARLSVRGKGSVLDGDQAVRRGATAMELTGDDPLHIELWHWDDQLWASIGGVELGPLEYRAPALPLDDNGSVQVRVGVQDGRVAMRSFEIDRDLYYDPSNALGIDVQVPQGKYWMLGDNTQNSDDGRSWRTLTLSYEPETMRLLEPGQGTERLIGNARIGTRDADQNPVFATAEGPMIFTDLQGEEHVLQASVSEFNRDGYANQAIPNDQQAGGPGPIGYARFVPQEYFLGRALAIFWPVGIGGPFRLSWIR
jgi:signal peptidase I